MWDSDPIKGDPLNRVRFRVVARGKTVTQCYYSSSDEQAEFDARLIAAAPELLEAAQAAWNCIAELPPTQARVETALLLQDAIAKATGAA